MKRQARGAASARRAHDTSREPPAHESPHAHAGGAMRRRWKPGGSLQSRSRRDRATWAGQRVCVGVRRMRFTVAESSAGGQRDDAIIDRLTKG